MILEFNQIDRQPNPLFEGKIGNELVITGKGATQSDIGYVVYRNKRIEISGQPHREKIGGKTATQVTDLLCTGKRVGYIYPDLVEKKKIFFISFGYDYFNYHFAGTDYTVYEVGLGVNQHYICVYKNNETIAIIKKEDKKINYCDKYTIYTLDKEELLSMAVLTMYFDCIRYPNHGEIMDESYTDDSFLTTQKELIDKYDPLFIEKVKKIDGILE